MYADIVVSIDAAFGYEYRPSLLDTFVDEHYPKVDLRSKDATGAVREENTRYLEVV